MVKRIFGLSGFLETCRAVLDFNAHGGYTFIRRGAEGAELIRFPLNDVTKFQDLIREYRKCM